MKKRFEFIVHPIKGEPFSVVKAISERSIYRVIVNLMRKHNAFEVERVLD
jgi:hypothetical protein